MSLRLSPREELLVELFRELHADQRSEVITRIRALKDANKTVEKLVGRQIKTVGNERIEAKFGKTPPLIRDSDRKNKPQPRRPDRNQDDSEPEV